MKTMIKLFLSMKCHKRRLQAYVITMKYLVCLENVPIVKEAGQGKLPNVLNNPKKAVL